VVLSFLACVENRLFKSSECEDVCRVSVKWQPDAESVFFSLCMVCVCIIITWSLPLGNPPGLQRAYYSLPIIECTLSVLNDRHPLHRCMLEKSHGSTAIIQKAAGMSARWTTPEIRSFSGQSCKLCCSVQTWFRRAQRNHMKIVK